MQRCPVWLGGVSYISLTLGGLKGENDQETTKAQSKITGKFFRLRRKIYVQLIYKQPEVSEQTDLSAPYSANTHRRTGHQQAPNAASGLLF
ncbi:hypothetical protein LDENG_00105130 [Lucifuga dentata]|nr:hypothetical protein LDENG_00105130 [Lucifuga dentata]